MFKLALGIIPLSAMLAADGDWPQFLGPDGRGNGDPQAKLPIEFGPSKALLWKTALAAGHGSPCVVGNRVFVTAFDSGAKKLETIAIDRASGKILWRRAAPVDEMETVHKVSSPATSTPASDGQRVYVYFGSYGLLAYEMDGRPAWSHAMGKAASPFGSGASPVVAQGKVIVHRDYAPKPAIYAVSAKDGNLAWKVDLPVSRLPGAGASHATPLIWRDRIVLHRPGEVAAHSLDTGARVWSMPTGGGGTSTLTADDRAVYATAFNVMASPEGGADLPPFADALSKYDKDGDGKLSRTELPDDDLTFRRRNGVPDGVPGAHFTVKMFFGMVDGIADGKKDGGISETEYETLRKRAKAMEGSFASSGLMAVVPEGDKPPAAPAWVEKRNVPETPAALAYRGRVYMIANGGIVTCVDASTGAVSYRARVNAPGSYYASPVAGGGKVFVASSEGVVTVLGAGEKLDVLANNDLGEPIYATPAPAGSQLFVRSQGHLWAFGNR